MSKWIILIITLFSSVQNAHCQQGNMWLFGGFAGLNFNQASPSTILTGALNTDEGCASISDNTGKLLFYTDGRFVWNSLNQIMPNGSGLKGDPSSSNSAIVIPKPGSNTIFYIFTADAAENTNIKGYNYTEVDMTLNGGLGDITSNKNILLYSPSTEKLTAFRSSNGIDIWVVTHAWGNNSWLTYKVTCSGVDPNPIVSNAGTNYIESSNEIYGGEPRVVNDESVGCLKASPDGKKLAATTVTGFGSNFWEVFDFNNATGIVSNAIRIDQPSPYGVEFSPDSKLLYVATETINYGHGSIIQYNLANFELADVLASATVIGESTFNTRIGALQIGPDGKIYCALEGSFSLATIINPNIVGTGCNFSLNQIDLKNGQCHRGLPVFFPSLVTNQNAKYSYTVNPDCSTVDFLANSTITGNLIYSWDFDDGTTGIGQNVTHQFTLGGFSSYKVKLMVTSDINCGNAISIQEINLNRTVPKAKFDFSYTCGSLVVDFTDQSTLTGANIQGWLWDFGDGQTSIEQNPVHTYSGFGSPTVSLKVTSSGICNGSDLSETTIPIESKPNSSFSWDAACLGKPVHFYDNSTMASGTINNWYWDFGNGSISNQQNPTTIYSELKTETVKFCATSSTGCHSDTLSYALSVSVQPKTNWTVLDTCFGETTAFTGTSLAENANIIDWNWDFGDMNSTNSANPFHVFRASGHYSVSLFITTSAGCVSDTVSRIIVIGAKPLSDFSFAEECGNSTIKFSDLSSASPDSISKWSWNFGDGNRSDIRNPQNVFPDFAPYETSLQVTSVYGCISEMSEKQVELRPKPKASFFVHDGCENQTVQFQDESKVAAGNILQYNWDLGNNTTSTEKNPGNLYAVPGVYQIKLAVTSDKQCSSDTVTQTLSIEAKPKADFAVKNGCADNPIYISNMNSISYGNIAQTNWYWGNGDESITEKPEYTYNQYGDYLIREVAVSTNGCVSDTSSHMESIGANPQVDFFFGNTCQGKEINFQNTSSIGSGTIASWLWDFANGEKSSSPQPSYTYNSYGDYPVSLTALSNLGCGSSKIKNIQIVPLNISAGKDTLASAGQPIRLSGSGAQQYIWSPSDFLDDPASSHPVAILTDNQTFTLTGTTSEGCVGVASVNITVYKNAGSYVPNAFTPNGDGLNDIFRPILPGISSLEYFSVFNRWGQRVFYTKQSGKGWDGNFNGAKAEEGTYVWMLKAIDYKGNIINQKGTVILIR